MVFLEDWISHFHWKWIENIHLNYPAYRNPSNGGRSTIFSIVIDDDSDSEDNEDIGPSDNPDGSLMSMLYSDSNTKAADQKDGPLELVEDDKEREILTLFYSWKSVT